MCLWTEMSHYKFKHKSNSNRLRTESKIDLTNLSEDTIYGLIDLGYINYTTGVQLLNGLKEKMIDETE